MELNRGTVVRTLAGHDKNRYMAVLSCDGKYVLIADGKTRAVCSPKKKNVIHISSPVTVLGEELLKSDKALRNALKSIAEEDKSV